MLLALAGLSCDRSPASTQPSDNAMAQRPGPVRVASLVPAATDLLLAAGLGDHLVAVSNYCHDNPDARRFPTAGDYQTTDWERLADLKPSVLLVFLSKDRLPPGMAERAEKLGIRIVNLKTETVQDVLDTLHTLGEVLGDAATAENARDRIASRLAAVSQRNANFKPVPTLLVLGDAGLNLVGPGTFLDELLSKAGGSNAGSGLGTRYPTVDEEKLATMRYDAVVVVMPGALPQAVEATKEAWRRRLGSKQAGVRVTVLTQWYLLLPGGHLPEIAEALEAALHDKGDGAPRDSGDGGVGRQP